MAQDQACHPAVRMTQALAPPAEARRRAAAPETADPPRGPESARRAQGHPPQREPVRQRPGAARAAGGSAGAASRSRPSRLGPSGHGAGPDDDLDREGLRAPLAEQFDRPPDLVEGRARRRPAGEGGGQEDQGASVAASEIAPRRRRGGPAVAASTPVRRIPSAWRTDRRATTAQRALSVAG